MTIINSARLRAMLAQVKPHMSTDITLPIVNLVQVERRGGHLYVIATDRYTMAITRTPVEGAEQWTARIPAYDLRTVEVWLKSAAGDIEVGLDGDALTLTSTTGALRLTTDAAGAGEFGEFPNWRKLVSGALESEPTEPVALTGYDTRFLARWKAAARGLHAWQAGPRKPLVLIDGDGLFVGIQMPTAAPESLTREALAAKWLADLGEPEADKPAADAA